MSRYVPPTAQEFRALLASWGLSQVAAARLAHISGRTVRLYCDPASRTKCPYPVLYTLSHQMTGRGVGMDWRSDYVAELRE